MVETETATAALVQDSREVGLFQQLYSTTLLDFHGGRAFEWAYVPGPLLEWDEPDLDWIFNATGLQRLVELPSLSALPATIVAMLETPGSPDQDSERLGGLLEARLSGLLAANLGSWSNEIDPSTLAFAQFAAFSAVLPVEWSPLEKVPPADAAFAASGATAAAGIAVPGMHVGTAAGQGLALALGAKGGVLVLAGAGGAVLGTVAFPLAAGAGVFLAWQLYRRKFSKPATASPKAKKGKKGKRYKI